jgi:hypothetical protein
MGAIDLIEDVETTFGFTIAKDEAKRSIAPADVGNRTWRRWTSGACYATPPQSAKRHFRVADEHMPATAKGDREDTRTCTSTSNSRGSSGK